MNKYGILSKEEKVYEKNLIVLRQDQIESAYYPTAISHYPDMYNDQECFVTINVEYKFRIWTYYEQNLICLYTCLGPNFAGIINRLILINDDYEDKYLLY